ncbi:MAG: hypothetical protein ACXAC2_11170 [Candidatus Kariarchaeaceae archaeon]|jgi:hypothetical protein
MSNIDVPNIVPDIFLVDDPVSASKSILSKQLLEFLPHENVTFSYNKNRIMRFNISSNSDFLVGPECYLKFNLRRESENVTTHFPNTRLDLGGAHALFRSIEVRALSSGMLIQRYNYYNRNYCLVSHLTQSNGYIKSMGSQYLDTIDYDDSYDDARYKLALYAGPDVNVNADTTTIDGTDVANLIGLNNIRPGDVISIQGIARCVVTVGATITTTGLKVWAAGVVSPQDVFIKKMSRCETQAWDGYPRVLGLTQLDNSEYTTVCMKLMLSTLEHTLPLFLMKGGIEIILELEQPNIALFTPAAEAVVLEQTLAEKAKVSYEIESPRFMGMTVTPHPDVVNEFVNQWKTSRGLVYRIPSWQVRRQTASNRGNLNMNFPFGVRSAMRGFLLQTSSCAANGDLYYPSLSLWQSGRTKKYQFKVGSQEFPHRDVLNLDDNNAEMWKQLMMAAGVDDMKMMGEPRLTYDKWNIGTLNNYIDNNSIQHYDAQKFIIGVDFARLKGHGDGLTGIDLSTVPLEFELERQSGYEFLDVVKADNNDGNIANYKPLIWMFVEHDAYLKISANQMNVLN